MRRFLFNLLTLLSLALCVLAVWVWLRSSTRIDIFTLRTAPSYGSPPNVKWA